MRHEAHVKTTAETGAEIEKVVLSFLIKEGLKKVTANSKSDFYIHHRLTR